MHKHEHNQCDHCLHFCSCCNKVYCCKCNQEWGNNYYQPYYPTYPTYPGITYWGGTTKIDNDWRTCEMKLNNCSHEHKGGE